MTTQCIRPSGRLNRYLELVVEESLMVAGFREKKQQESKGIHKKARENAVNTI